MGKVKRIVLVGKAGSGKDFLRDAFVSKEGLLPDISVTTRPKRQGEANGSTYYYIHRDIFNLLHNKGMLYESIKFNGWSYGTLLESWRSSDVFIFTPSGIGSIKRCDRKKCFIVYLDIPESVRRERISKRSDADKVDRRIEADKKDFSGFSDFDMVIEDPFFDVEKTIAEIFKQTKWEEKSKSPWTWMTCLLGSIQQFVRGLVKKR